MHSIYKTPSKSQCTKCFHKQAKGEYLKVTFKQGETGKTHEL